MIQAAEKRRNPFQNKAGICLCLFGAVSFVALGVSAAVRPAVVDRLNASSAITLNGSGLLLLASLLAMGAGVFLLLRKNR